MAYALATRLLRAVKNSGLDFTEVAGWKNRGRGVMGTIQTVTMHHTATPRSYMKSNDIPTLNVLKNGHGTLPGPLSQIGLGRSGHVYLVAAGRANHAGRSRATSMTNPHAVGIEAEGAMESWPAQQFRAYVLLVAALLTEFGLANGRALRHAETCSPAGRKVDASFSGPAFRRDVANVKPGTTLTPESEKGLLGMTKNIYYHRTKPQNVRKGADRHLMVNDKGTQYTVATGACDFSVTVRVDISGLPKDKTARLKLAVVSYKAGTPTQVVTYGAIDEVYGSDGYTYAHATLTKRIPKTQDGRSLRVRALLASDVDVSVNRVVVSGLRD